MHIRNKIVDIEIAVTRNTFKNGEMFSENSNISW